MKRSFLSLVLYLTVGTSAQADNAQVVCRIMGLDAGQAMELRQSGKSPLDVIGILSRNKPKNSAYTKFIKTMVEEAFDKPRYTTSQYKRQAVEDFTARYEMMCLKSQ